MRLRYRLQSNLARAFAAFKYRDFKILWFGAFTSTVGNWMQKVAQSWLVFDLTKSSFYLGLDDFLGQLPILLFTLVGGVVADRHDRRHVILGSQLVQICTSCEPRITWRRSWRSATTPPTSVKSRIGSWPRKSSRPR